MAKYREAVAETLDALLSMQRSDLRKVPANSVMGVGGNGAIYSMIVSQIIPTLLKGKHDKDAALFRFRD